MAHDNFDQLRSLLAGYARVPREDVTAETLVRDLVHPLDSLDIVDVMLMFEDELRLRPVPPNVLARLRSQTEAGMTVAQLADELSELRN